MRSVRGEQPDDRRRIDSPPTASNCLGVPAPSRSPRPPAATIATTRMSAHSPVRLPASGALGPAPPRARWPRGEPLMMACTSAANARASSIDGCSARAAASIGGWTASVTSPGAREAALPHHVPAADNRQRARSAGPPRSPAGSCPPLKRPTRPSALRVPSGNTMSDRPFDDQPAPAARMPARSGCRRSTSRWPVRRRCQPRNGNGPSDSLAMIRSWNGSDQKTTGMS